MQHILKCLYAWKICVGLFFFVKSGTIATKIEICDEADLRSVVN